MMLMLMLQSVINSIRCWAMNHSIWNDFIHEHEIVSIAKYQSTWVLQNDEIKINLIDHLSCARKEQSWQV